MQLLAACSEVVVIVIVGVGLFLWVLWYARPRRLVGLRLGIVLLACQVGYGCGSDATASPATDPASLPQPSASASAPASPELKVAECGFLRQAADDSRRLQSVRSPFHPHDRALAAAIYGRTNSSLGDVSALLDEATRTNRVDDATGEAYLAIVSVTSQLSAAALAVSPDIRPSYVARGSPDLVLADLALADGVIKSASAALSCLPVGG